MIIAVDGNEANVSEKVGVSIYTFQLLTYFQKWANKDTQFVIFLKKPKRPELPEASAYFTYSVYPGPLWSQFILPMQLYKNKLFSSQKIDVFFSPAHYAPRFSPVPTIVTIHDLAYFMYPHEFLKKDLYQLTNWTKYSVHNAQKIIAVSKTTKKDIMHYYQIPENKIKVIYNGFDNKSNNQNRLFNNENPLIEYLNKNKYILFVGTLQPRKNISFLIAAFAQVLPQFPDLKLVIVGKKGWLYDHIFSEISRLKIEQSILFTGFASDTEKTYAYMKAQCLVLPSLYEGFGLPVLEAMDNDCPVLASFTSSLPEVGKDAAIYFDPKDVSDLTEDITTILTNKTIRDTLIKKGHERVKEFSWETCAKQTLHELTQL